MLPLLIIKRKTIIMEITNAITNAVKDVVAISKSVASTVKTEVESYYEARKVDNEIEDEMDDVDSDAATDDTRSTFFNFEEIEQRVRKTFESNIARFSFAKADDIEALETRLDELETKLDQLLSEGLEALNK